MSVKFLIIGLNIGTIYVDYFNRLGIEVDTLDIDTKKNPTYTEYSEITSKYDAIVICSPNYTHDTFIEKFWDKTDCFIVDKPGLADYEKFKHLTCGTNKRIMMIKNNLYRPELKGLNSILWDSDVSSVDIKWNNKNRIPFPGGWFTHKEKAYGGVSRDLLPHLLSFFYGLTGEIANVSNVESKQNWNMNTVIDTDYGVINTIDPVYNVDDYCKCDITYNGIQFRLEANWKTNIEDNISITFNWEDGRTMKYNFGLCPVNAYEKMIDSYLTFNEKEYKKNLNVDLWIHKIMELF
ncbi:MAG: Gfo/Idh/MocA family protein [Candidatus Kapaibacteriota bacterium]